MVLDQAIDNEGTPAPWWVNGRKGMPPTAPAAPVTRIELSCLWFVVMSLTLSYVSKGELVTRVVDRALSSTAAMHTPLPKWVTNCLADECRARQVNPRKRTPIGERERLN